MSRSYLFRGLLIGAFLWGAVSDRASSDVPAATAASTAPESARDLLQQAAVLEGSDTNRCLALAQQALEFSRRQGGEADQLTALWQIAKAARLLNDYTGATEAVNAGLTLAARAKNERMRGELLLVQGTAEWNQGKLVEATGHLMGVLRLAEKLGDKPLQFGARTRLGLVRGRYDDPSGELTHLNEARQLAKEIGDPMSTATILNCLGNHYMNTHEYDQARDYLEQALPLVRGSSNQRMIAFVLINLGAIATETGDQPLARGYLDEAMAICQRCRNLRGIADAHYLLAGVDRRSGAVDAALDHLGKALTIAEGIKNPDLLASVYEEYVRTEEAHGNYPAAVAYARKLEGQRQGMRNEASQRRAVEARTRYEDASHLQQVELLRRDKDLQAAALALAHSELIRTRTQYMTLAAILGVSLAVLIGRLRIHVVMSRRSLAESRHAKERAERETRESEARFRSAFDHSALGMALVARDGRWLRVNRALCDVVGYSVEEMLSTDFQTLTHPDDLAPDLQRVEQMLRGEISSYHLEKRYFHKAGHVVWAGLDVSLVRDDRGQPRYFISQVQDITGRKHAAEALQAAKEEAERANNTKSEFLSRTSHELRTPLNAILGFGQLLEIEDLTARQRQSVGHVLTAGQHLLGLINDVLDMAKVENGRMALSVEPVLLAGAAREALDLVRPLASAVSVRLLPLPDADGIYVAADSRRLRQVLLNLLSNAIKFNRAGGEITLGWRLAEGGRRVCVEVADTGMGMTREESELIFSPFTRLPTSEKIEGTGLGLTLTRALTEAMGGTVRVRSVPGEGSVFTVELAAETAPSALPGWLDEAAKPTAKPAPLRAAEWPGGGSLLYIEDNLTNLQLVECLVEDHAPGLRLMSAMQGRLGLDLAREHRPDLILLDLNLPDLHGSEVLQALRRQPETARVPVIVISADATDEQIRRMRMLGVFDYLTKPFVVTDFIRVLDEVLQAQMLAREDAVTTPTLVMNAR